jgi:hypothetical protein
MCIFGKQEEQFKYLLWREDSGGVEDTFLYTVKDVQNTLEVEFLLCKHEKSIVIMV